MHEHLVFGYPGHDGDRTMWRTRLIDGPRGKCQRSRSKRPKAQGFQHVVRSDPERLRPQPVAAAGRLAEETGFNVICATGYYYEGEGAPAYFGFRSLFADIVAEVSGADGAPSSPKGSPRYGHQGRRDQTAPARADHRTMSSP